MLMADLYVRMGIMPRKEGSSTRPLIVGRITACLKRGLTISADVVSIPATPRCQSRSLATQSLCAARGSAYFCRASPICHAILVYEMFFNPNFTSLTNGDYPSNKPTNSLCISNSTGFCHETSFIFDSREEPPGSIPDTPTLLRNRFGQLKLKHQLLRC